MRNPSIIAVLLLCACAPQTATAPDQPDRPIDGADGFQLAPDTRVLAGRDQQAKVVPSTPLTLPQLIDVAQRNNPATRAAWLRARQAAEAVGLVETTYLPRINAQILAGAARSTRAGYQDPAGLLPDGTVSLGGNRAMTAVSLHWLLFDFGKREAASAEARELSFAANVGFSGAHQTLIHQVTQAYHDLHAATRREHVHAQRLANARSLSQSARARRDQGLSTIPDVARADQSVAQAQFDLARARSETRAAQTKLTQRLGLPAGHPVRAAFPSRVRLPSRVPAALDRYIERSLSRRPDLQAAFARARASEQHTRAVEAEFRPRIVASATLGHTLGSTSLSDSRLPGAATIRTDRPIASGFVGITIPLWDGGAKERRLRIARDQNAATLAEAEGLRILAEAEIVGAYELLQSALAANIAARELVGTSRVSYDAAMKFSEEGLASVAEVSLARQLLLDAEIAQIEAQHAAMSAAATLAFASGQLG